MKRTIKHEGNQSCDRKMRKKLQMCLLGAGAIMLLCGLLWSVMAQTLGKTYELKLTGTAWKGEGPNTLCLSGEAQGTVPGAFRMTLHYDEKEGRITDGTWTLMVHHKPKGDGKVSGRGTLSGSITGGKVTINKEGEVVSIDEVQVSVGGGSQAYAVASGGSGELAGKWDQKKSPPFEGRLQLRF